MLMVTAGLPAASALGVAGSGLLGGLDGGEWAYWALALSAMLTEELSPILGGIAVNEGQLVMGRVIFAVSMGAWIFTAGLYILGRMKWEWIRRRWPRVRATGTVALRVVARNPITASLFARFAFGLRIVLPMACGAARVPLTIFIPATLVGSIAWSVLFAFVGYAAGQAAVTVIARYGRVGEAVGAVGLLLVAYLAYRWNKKRQQRKIARKLALMSRTDEMQ